MIIPYREFPFQGRTIHRPTINIRLVLEKNPIDTWGLLDTGATNTLINKKIGEQLGVDFATLPKVVGIGVEGRMQTAWKGKLGIEVDNFRDRIEAQVSYLAKMELGVILGHTGFFEFFTVKFETKHKRFTIELAE